MITRRVTVIPPTPWDRKTRVQVYRSEYGEPNEYTPTAASLARIDRLCRPWFAEMDCDHVVLFKSVRYTGNA